jgi:hypothetical protein
VIVSEARPDEFLPPPGITRRGAVGQQPPRREYDHGAKLITDRALGEERPWAGGPLVDALAAAIADRLRRDLRALLEE